MSAVMQEPATGRRMSNARLLMAVLIDPRSAFHALAERPTYWFPIVLLTLGNAAAVLWYFGVVDQAWFVEATLQRIPDYAQMTEAQKAQAAGMLARDVLMWSSFAAVMLGLPLMRLAEAAYYLLVGRGIGSRKSFSHWLALASWSSMPSLLALAASFVFLAMHPNGQVTQEQLYVLSLAELLGVSDRNAWYSMLATVTVLHPWILWLCALGLHLWSARSMPLCLGLAVLPWAVLYGIWALIVSMP